MNFDLILSLFSIILLISMMAFFFYREKALLLFFQQEEYESGRFLRWVWDKKAFDKRASILIFGSMLIESHYIWRAVVSNEYQITNGFMLFSFSLQFIAFIWGIQLSRKALSNSKKPLVMTMRAKRILGLAFLLSITSLVLAIYFLIPWVYLLFLQLPPVFLILANMLLKPFEARVKNKFLSEAKEKVRALNPIVIAISGSYGKTSTKHILAHILEASAPTLATPGSVNTEMGVTRIIREQLEKRHKFFVVEMGAYGEGSIAKLCDLAPPKMGIITGIGQAHLERFGDVETIFKAKFELSKAATKNGGSTIINATRTPQNLLQERLDENVEQYTMMRLDDDSASGDFYVKNIKADENGLHFNLIEKSDDGKEDSIAITAPVYGSHQAENIGLAIIAAKKLGVPIDTIKAALRNLPQTRHRLELFKSDQGPWVLDDAYNSNPKGFEEALLTLGILTKRKGNEGRAILITPGMVELGTDHDKEHYEIGKLAGGIVDIAAIVTPERIPSFIKGFEEVQKPKQELHKFASQDEAQNWVKAKASSGDVILYENNLPDLFEAKVRF